MNASKLIFSLFSSRLREIDRYNQYAAEIQQQQMLSLIETAKSTHWGGKYEYKEIHSYELFAQRVPLQTYDDIKGYVERMRLNGEQNLLWPSKIECFSKSSGTTSDKSKFIPVSREALEDCHYQGGKDVTALYSRINHESDFFSGKGLILGGSHSGGTTQNGIITGDLSAILIQNISPIINLIRVPSKEVALMSEWESKMDAIIESTKNENVTNLSGVPSWFLTLIKRLLHKTGKNNLLEIWPNLEVFFHGGVSFGPYREEFRKLIPSSKMLYMETYNASEGFFGIQSNLNDPSLLLMIDLGIFFEFIPMSEFDKEHPKAIPLWEVELNTNYAVVISTNAGLWRYIIGDTVMFTSKKPYKFIITGRTRLYINTFGEEVIIDNAEKAIVIAAKETGAIIKEYTAAPHFMSTNTKGYHQWLIEFSKQPDSLEQFSDKLDKSLQSINSDYEAKRYKDLTLLPLQIVVARENLFEDWLGSKGKLGGQHKVPRLSNSRTIIEEILSMNN